MMCSARLSCRSPPRLSRGRSLAPEQAWIGAAAPSAAAPMRPADQAEARGAWGRPCAWQGAVLRLAGGLRAISRRDAAAPICRSAMRPDTARGFAPPRLPTCTTTGTAKDRGTRRLLTCTNTKMVSLHLIAPVISALPCVLTHRCRADHCPDCTSHPAVLQSGLMAALPHRELDIPVVVKVGSAGSSPFAADLP